MKLYTYVVKHAVALNKAAVFCLICPIVNVIEKAVDFVSTASVFKFPLITVLFVKLFFDLSYS
jgi:hypothetical protein